MIRRDRRWLLIAAIAAVAAVAVAVPLVLVGGSGSAQLRPILARPAAYQVVYRVDALTSGTTVTTWEMLTVHRPYASSDVVYRADPRVSGTTAQTPTKATWFDIDTLYTLDGTGTIRRVSGRQPGLAGNDQALGVELDTLAQRKLAKATDRRQVVAGRRCRVVRFVEPPVGPIKPLTGTDHDDLCLDDAGLILSEKWTINGHLAYRRTAVQVRIAAVSDPLPLTNPQPLPGAGAQATAVPGSDPGAPIKPPPTPDGYAPSQPVIFTLPAPTGPGLAARSTVWSFSRGADVITVEAGLESGGHYPWDGQQTAIERIHLPGLGDAFTVLTSEGPQVQVPLGPGRWVRVTGTIPLSALVSYAQRLTPAQ